ncbi:rCG25548 [Rattus norvegicus]|uniref:RCG25548 n=1 Tax=Rattus norvegicus TaxID=10116 RepID=A6I3S2_RAT|nr:rCG25548 [Rattus norvegicus]
MRAWPIVSLGPDSEYPRFTGHPGFCHVKAARHRLNARRSPRSHDRQGAARGPVGLALILLRTDIHCHPKRTWGDLFEQGSSSSSPYTPHIITSCILLGSQ